MNLIHRDPGHRYDVLVIGAGPAGLLAAIEVCRRARAARVAVMDSGPSLDRRTAADAGGAEQLSPWSGFGGAGFFIGGRLALDPSSPSSLPRHAEQTTELVGYVRRSLQDWGGAGTMLADPPPELLATAERAAGHGLHWHLNYPALHLDAEERIHVLSAISEELALHGVGVLPETRATGLERCEAGWAVSAVASGEPTTIVARNVVLAPGRGGAAWLAGIIASAGASVTSRRSVGVRIEVRSEVMAALTDLTPDPRFSMSHPCGEFRTYACARGSRVVVDESTGIQRMTLRPGGADPSENTSVSILWEPADPRLAVGTPTPTRSRLDQITSFPNAAGPVGDPKPTGQISPGNVREHWPEQFWSGFAEMLTRINALAPGTAAAGTVVYSPAIEQYWDFGVRSDGGIGLPGIFLAGDGAGVSMGAMAAAVSGVIAGRGVTSGL